MQRDALGHFVVQGTGRKYHVLGPRSESALSEAIDVMNIAHPVSAHLAVTTIPTRDDLFADCMVPDLQAIEFSGAIAETDHLADEFVTRGYGRLTISNARFITPKERGSGGTFNITCAHPSAFDVKDPISGSWLRHWSFLPTPTVPAVRCSSLHCFW